MSRLKKLAKYDRDTSIGVFQEYLSDKRQPEVAEREAVGKLLGPGDARRVLAPGSVIIAPSQLELVPKFLPFYATVHMHLCASCNRDLIANPACIEPYLAAGVLIPFLTGKVADYPLDFLDFLSPYLHVKPLTGWALENIRVHAHEHRTGVYDCGDHAAVVCRDCMNRAKTAIVAAVEGQRLTDRQALYISNQVRRLASRESLLGLHLLQSFAAELPERQERAITEWASILTGFNDQTDSIGHNAAKPLRFDALASVFEVNESLFTTYSPLGRPVSMDAVEQAAVSLALDFSPDMSIPEYLEIVRPHMGACRAIVEPGPASDEGFAEVLDRVEEMNREIRRLAGTKRYRVACFVESIVRGNRELLEPLIGGALGLATSGAAGCVGGATGAAAIKKLATGLHLPAESRRSLADALGPVTMKLVTAYYGTTPEVIHVWRLRKGLGAA